MSEKTSKKPETWTQSGSLDFLRFGPEAAQQLLETTAHPDYESHKDIVRRGLAEMALEHLNTPHTGGVGVVEGDDRHYISLQPEDLGARLSAETQEKYGLPPLATEPKVEKSKVAAGSQRSISEASDGPAVDIPSSSESSGLDIEEALGTKDESLPDTTPEIQTASEGESGVGLLDEALGRFLTQLKNLPVEEQQTRLRNQVDDVTTAFNGVRSAYRPGLELHVMEAVENFQSALNVMDVDDDVESALSNVLASVAAGTSEAEERIISQLRGDVRSRLQTYEDAREGAKIACRVLLDAFEQFRYGIDESSVAAQMQHLEEAVDAPKRLRDQLEQVVQDAKTAL